MARQRKKPTPAPEIIETLSEVLAPTYTLEVKKDLVVPVYDPAVKTVEASIGFTSVFDEKTFKPNIHLVLKMNGQTRKTVSGYPLEVVQDSMVYGCKVDSIISYRRASATSYEFIDADQMKRELKALDKFYGRDFSRFHDELAKDGLYIRDELTVETILTTIHTNASVPVILEIRK